jgi:Putative peptidoglycan binding domain
MRRALPTLLVASFLALPATAFANAVDRDGMWIWRVSRSSGGVPAQMAARAAQHQVGTVIIKAADGRTRWGQFNRPLVAALKQQGLRVCAYQFVYGRYPRAEAERGAEAARNGADCLLIDAEGRYEGRYASAQRYLTRLRARVGPSYEVGLTSFPYVTLHPALPYSVFLGPGGAQENLPQMYWTTIGVSPDRIYNVTYTLNKVYGRPIYPLGQTYARPSFGSVVRFRKLARVYGARGVSWWVWQYSGDPQWNALGSPFDPIGLPIRRDTLPLLRRGSKSDLVVWAQQHLMKLGLLGVVNGRFGAGTQRAVGTFQSTHGLAVTGQIDAPTWQRLLPSGPATVRWSKRRRLAVAAGGRRVMPQPLNARQPAVRNELRGKPGR